MNINDENSCVTNFTTDQFDENGGRRRRSKGKRRSSILKMKSALEDIDANAQNSDETTGNVKSKKSRRSSSRRVSFAETCQIKEIPTCNNKNIYPYDQQFCDESTAANFHLEVSTTGDESTYRQPAPTLAGLSSLLSSPIQESPQKQSFYQEAVNNDQSDFIEEKTSLEFTRCYGISPSEEDNEFNEMELTRNQTLQIIQKEMDRPDWDVENNFAEKTSSLEFTKCYSDEAACDDVTSDQMDLTVGVTGFGNDVINNQGPKVVNKPLISTQRQVLGQLSIDQQVKTAEQNVTDNFENTRKVYSINKDDVKVDGLAFLRELSVSKRDNVTRNPLGDKIEFTTTRANISNEEHGGNIGERRESGFGTRDMDITHCQSARGVKGRYEGEVGFQIALDRNDEDMDMTRCQPDSDMKKRSQANIGLQAALDRNGEDMDMTRCQSGRVTNERRRGNIGLQVSLGRNEDMDMTRCQSGSVTNERSRGNIGLQFTLDKNEDMDMTRCQSGSDMKERSQGNIGLQVSLGRNGEDMDMTRCQSGGDVNEQSQGNIGLQFALDRNNENMDMTRCQPSSDIPHCPPGAQGKHSFHIAVDESDREMEFTRCHTEGKVYDKKVESGIGDHFDMEMTRCIPQDQPRYESKHGFHIALDEDIYEKQGATDAYIEPQNMDITKHVVSGVIGTGNQQTVDHGDMDITRCQTVEGQDYFENQVSQHKVNSKGNPQTEYSTKTLNKSCGINDHCAKNQASTALNMTCPIPSQRNSGVISGRDETSLDEEDKMEMTRCVTEPRNIGSTSQVINQPSHAFGTTNNYQATGFDVEESGLQRNPGNASQHSSHCLNEWNIDISQFAKENKPVDRKDITRQDAKLPALNKGLHSSLKSASSIDATIKESTPEIPESTLETKEALPEIIKSTSRISESALSTLGSAKLKSNSLKQGNLERKATLSLNTTDEGVPKRRAFLGDMTVSLPVNTKATNAVSQLSMTLPVESSGARLVSKTGTNTNVVQNSSWTGTGTHEVVHAGRSIFGAKGPSIGSKLSLLNRNAALKARVKNTVVAKQEVTTPVSGNQGNTSETKSSGSKHESKIADQKPSCDIVLSKEEKSTQRENEVNKSHTLNNSEESFITDEKSDIILMPDEMLDIDMKMKSDGKMNESLPTANETEDTSEDTLNNSYDAFRSQLIPTRAQLSIISEESAIDQSMKVKESDKKIDTLQCDEEVSQALTFEDVLAMAGLSSRDHFTKRSQTPVIEPELSELKDQIYTRCLFAAKFNLWDSFTKELQSYITENKRLVAVKKKEMEKCNPSVSPELQSAFDSDKDSVIEKLKNLKRVCRYQAFVDWFGRRTKLNKHVLIKLKEQEELLRDDVSTLEKREKQLDDCMITLDNLDIENDKKFNDLEALLELEEKEWTDYKKTTEEARTKLEAFEQDLQAQENKREQLVRENNILSNEIAEEKKRSIELESSILHLEQKKSTASSVAEVERQLRFVKGIQEWILEEYNGTSFMFTFLCRTFDLNVVFEDTEEESLIQKIKHVDLESRLSENSIPLAKLGHQLVIEKFSNYNFIEMFPTRDSLPQLLHLVSESIARVRTLIEGVQLLSINHIMSLTDKVLTIEFSSLQNFLKFMVKFDLDRVVSDGVIPYSVVKKIGTISSEIIEKELSNFPSTILCFTKLVEAADKFLK